MSLLVVLTLTACMRRLVDIVVVDVVVLESQVCRCTQTPTLLLSPLLIHVPAAADYVCLCRPLVASLCGVSSCNVTSTSMTHRQHMQPPPWLSEDRH